MQELDNFYALLKSGTNVGTFLNEYKKIFPLLHSYGYTNDIRFSKGICSRLASEISPVAHYAMQNASKSEHICFPLDSNPVDCFLGADRIQVTAALEKSRQAEIRHLTEHNVNYGSYVENDDDEKPLREYIEQAKKRLALSNSKSDNIEEIVQINVEGISRAVEKKQSDKQNNILIVKLPPTIAMYGENAINQCALLLSEKPIYTNYSKIFAVSYASDSHDFCFPVVLNGNARP